MKTYKHGRTRTVDMDDYERLSNAGRNKDKYIKNITSNIKYVGNFTNT